MTDESERALLEAREISDDLSVSEFFGGEEFDNLCETLTDSEVDALLDDK